MRPLHESSHLHGHHPSLLSLSKVLALLSAASWDSTAKGGHTQWFLMVEFTDYKYLITLGSWLQTEKSPAEKSTYGRMKGGKECSSLLCSSWPHPSLRRDLFFWSEHTAGTILRPGAERSKPLLLFLKSSLETLSTIPHGQQVHGWFFGGPEASVYLESLALPPLCAWEMFLWESNSPQPWLHLNPLVPGWLILPGVNHCMSLGIDSLINMNSSCWEVYITASLGNMHYLLGKIAVPLTFILN